jgi:low affinity Fe/Cu permease
MRSPIRFDGLERTHGEIVPGYVLRCNRFAFRALKPFTRQVERVHRPLYFLAEFLSKPPGFLALLAVAVACVLLLGTSLATELLSISAIAITGVVLIQNYRDTASMQAKLNEIIVALESARNEVVGLEHGSPEEIETEKQNIEQRASTAAQPVAAET